MTIVCPPTASVVAWLAALALAPVALAKPVPRAPNAPPLLAPYAVDPLTGPPDASASAPPSQGDVLAGNGLSSPFCDERAELPSEARHSCEAARFALTPYPTGNYAFDVNIDTGVAKWSNDASAVVQNFTQLAWVSLVALAHSLVVMLEWCYSLDLPGRMLLDDAGRQLKAMGLSFTQPWLALSLSLLSALVVYHGLFRRRVVQTLGQALATAVMMAAGLWVMLDPAGTVGGLQQWSDQAGVGVLAVGGAGTPDRPRRALVAGLGEIFGAAVTAPWCYMEFGDVHWCQDPHRLDPRLRAAALRIASGLESAEGCRNRCSSGGRRRSSAGAAGLLRGAQTNGELFLALPANEVQRNSVKTAGTLLNVLCGGGESASSCRGPGAMQAQFRSESGTYSRVIGLLLIWAGALGMLLLFGYLAMRLLLSGILTVVYLLLAPVAVLVAAFGERGRCMFKGWGVRLLLASVSKLSYSFALGLMLAATAMLLRLTLLGWWAQWLLVSAFWWMAFVNRHHAFGLARFEREPQARFERSRRSVGRRAQEAMQSSAALFYAADRAKRLLFRAGGAIPPTAGS